MSKLEVISFNKQIFHAVSLSGGKDSTAMLLLMIERGLPINTVLWADTGMEFPEMYDHIRKVDDYLYRERGIHITMLRHPKGFEYLMFEEEKQKPSSIENRQRLGVPLYGNGWPGVKVRWCTGQLKTHLISKEVNRLKGEYQALHYVGIAADEPKRIKNEQYPLVDWGITEAEALKLCYGPYQIASRLKEEKILIPSAYLARHGEGVNKNKTFKDVYGWGSSTICNILEKREYLGHTINFKTRKHFKDKKSHYVPEDEWTIFENTHEAIIDQQTFDLVQKIRGNVRRYPDGWGEAAPLTGLLYCADCGGKMYVHRTNNGKRISQYTCSQYSKVPVGKLCTTQHRINEDVVLSLVSEMLKAIAEYAKHDRAEFVRVVQEAQSSQQTAEVRKQRTRLATAKQRVSELEVLLCKIYEDNILGKLSDSRYATLDAQYEKEQSELTAEISALEKAVKSYEKHEKDADRFIALIDKYENFDKLTIAMLNEFIEKILVHERDRKGSIQTTQEVEIYFNFVGRFVPPAFGEVELTPEELEEIRKREERKDRLHQNYLKRKASGAQKRYEDKIKGRKKAEIEAKKAAIRAEDIAKGVFVPVSSLPQREPMKGVQTA